MPIDLLNTYSLLDITADLRLTHFNTLVKGNPVLLRAFISNEPHPFIPDVFNLAFGPPKEGFETEIDDQANIKHDDTDMVISTLLLFAYTFLSENREAFVGIDGSCNRRALLYFKKFQANHEAISAIFKVAGNKYYIRFKRFLKPGNDLDQEKQLEMLINGIKENIDIEDIQVMPETIDRNTTIKGIEYNFNYFTFSLL